MKVVRRLLKSLVWASETQIHAWSRFDRRRLRALLEDMEETGQISAVDVEEWGRGWVLSSNGALDGSSLPPSSVLMMHRADPLVRAHGTELQERYADREILQYLLIDGALSGAVCGHWRIKAHDADDIVTGLPEAEALLRREEVLAEVRRGYGPPDRQVLRYQGTRIS